MRKCWLPWLSSYAWPHLGDGLAGKESASNAGDLGSIPVLGRSPGEGKCYPLLYSGLENSMDWLSVDEFKKQSSLFIHTHTHTHTHTFVKWINKVSLSFTTQPLVSSRLSVSATTFLYFQKKSLQQALYSFFSRNKWVKWIAAAIKVESGSGEN